MTIPPKANAYLAGYRRGLSTEERVTWRYVASGRVRHALSPGLYSSVSGAACGVYVVPSSSWLGTGTQAEYERVEQLPPCKSCLAALRRNHGMVTP